VTFSGAAGQQRAATSEAMPMTIDGRSAWLQAPDPAHPGNTISLFDSLDQTISALATTGQSSAQVAQIVSTGLGGIDAAAANLSSWRSHAGAQLTRADGIDARLSQAKLDAQTQRSAAEDLDMVQAVSEFQSRQSGYDAALKTYSMVQQMSLFQYIK
jgi:flagellar hook-associated protein 3 FlgL